MSLWVVFQVFCLVQGLTTGLYLLTRRGQPAAARWLGWLVLALTLQVLDYCLASSGVYFRHKWLYFTPLFFSWCYGPLLWGAARAWYGAERPLSGWHFVPGGVQLVFYLLVSAQDFKTKTWFWLQVHKPYTRYLEYYGAIASVWIYLWLAARLVRAHQRRPRWLWWGLLGLAVFYALAALDPLVNEGYLPAGAPKFYLTSLLLPVLAYAAALLGWLKGGATTPGLPVGTTVAPPVEATAGLPAKAPAPPDSVQLARLVQAMQTEALYRDPDLSLGSLARHLDLPPNTVSHLINAGIGETFTEWVNSCRLAEVERRMRTADAQRYTLLALALEAGFNSKTTFNRAFKERNELTPSAYKKKYQATLRDDTTAAGG
ncbi:helix-turn-helix domain-containing protein [Hymenobacter lapidiphilus]|uniref:Helix-turn-helix transcriptional regulator n=1 Tax=Hymenobacter lapidiphilus TaxID=2608003 RepID=A0A7Y7U5T3_9BACT|nr:AraC family transcriptional regulator [Hymenobacter lapidiphilus]NVO31632.1 helix-turn-helix transcriptional regulator [Hymenobacter lapidiphilus]